MPSLHRALIAVGALLAGLTGCKKDEQPAEPAAQSASAAASAAESAPAAAAAPPTSPEDVLKIFETNFGVNPGQRRNHIKGICAVGEFVGHAEAGVWSTSKLFSGEKLSVVARFSLPGGNPKISDKSASSRGLALAFYEGDQLLQNMAMVNIPIFAAATPASFLAGLAAAGPDPETGKPNPEKIKAYREAHPDSAPLVAFMSTYKPPKSFAQAPYYSVNAFKLIGPEGRETFAKWQFTPSDGVHALTDAELAEASDDFLHDALRARIAEGPIEWRMELILADAKDPTDNPTLAWPEDRRKVSAGFLKITQVAPQTDVDCNSHLYDPSVLADGMALSDDPILAFRPAIYHYALSQRQAEKAKADDAE